MGNRLDRIALVVNDLEAVAADLDALLGLSFVVRDVDTMGIRVGLGEDGIELVQKTAPDCAVERFWRGPLAALVIRVDDIDAMTARLVSAGYELDHELATAGGMKERHFGSSFHGIPLVLYSSPTSLVEATEGQPAPRPRPAPRPGPATSGDANSPLA